MTSRGVLALAPLQIAQALVGFGAIAVFTRLMNAEEFGRYALALSASMLAHTLLFTWLEAAAFRFLGAARAERRLGDHFATLLALALGLGGLALAATAAVLTLARVDAELAALCWFAAGAAVLRVLVRIARESDRADLAVSRYAALEAMYLVVGFCAGAALLVYFDFGAAAPFAGLMAAGLLVVVLDAPRLLARARGRLSLPRAGAYAAYGAPLALALAVDLGVQTFCRFILAHEAGAAEVGAYAAAFGLARPLDLLFMAAGAALSPLLLASYQEDGAGAVRKPAQHGFVLMSAVGAPAAIGLALVAAPLSSLMLGEGVARDAARALPWLALAGLMTGFNLYYFSEAFQLARRTGLRAALMLAPGALQILLTFALVREHGALGAAVAACAAATAGAALLCLVGRHFVALPLAFGDLARVGAASAVMGAVVYAVPGAGAAELPWKVAAGGAVYALATLALNIAGARTLLFAKLRPVALVPSLEQSHAR